MVVQQSWGVVDRGSGSTTSTSDKTTHQLGDGILGEFVLFIPFTSVWSQFFVGKLATHFVDHAMFFGQLRMRCVGPAGSGGGTTTDGAKKGAGQKGHGGG